MYIELIFLKKRNPRKYKIYGTILHEFAFLE